MTTNKKIMSENKKRFNNNSVLLENFDQYKLRITVDDCVDRNLYHIGYQKHCIYTACSLHLIIPEFYGHVEQNNGRKYLVIEKIGNILKVLEHNKELWSEIIKRINKISTSVHVFKDE